MELLKAILLGIIQGLTEFLPISSSGHLVLFSKLLDFQDQGIVFDVFLHLGTLAAVLLVFYEDVWDMIKAPFLLLMGKGDNELKKAFLWDIYIILATLPTVFVGLFFKESIEQFFSNILVVYLMLTITGILMICSQFVAQSRGEMTYVRSWWVGCAQACAVLPGLSRSGTTIFVGMLLGVERQTVARFSFIMSIPAILGAVVLQGSNLIANHLALDALVNILAGTLASVISGYLAIKLLLDIIRKNRLQWFGYYCLIVASAGFCHYFVTSA